MNHCFRDQMTSAVETIRLILELTRAPRLAEDKDHTYDDKFGLAGFVLNSAMAAQVNAFEALGLDEEKLLLLLKLVHEEKRSSTRWVCITDECTRAFWSGGPSTRWIWIIGTCTRASWSGAQAPTSFNASVQTSRGGLFRAAVTQQSVATPMAQTLQASESIESSNVVLEPRRETTAHHTNAMDNDDGDFSEDLAKTASNIIDFTAIPNTLNAAFDKHDTDNALRTVIIKTGEVWTRRRKEKLLTKLVKTSLSKEEQTRKKKRRSTCWTH